MINLQVLLLVFFRSATAANLLTLVLVGGGGFAWWHYRRLTDEPGSGARSLSLLALSCLTLLVGYHRNYDAALLLFALPGLPHLWRQGRRGLTLAISCLLLPFMLPLPAYLVTHFPEWTSAAASVPSQLALKHQVVLLLLLAVTSLYAMRPKAQGQPAVTSSYEVEALIASGGRWEE